MQHQTICFFICFLLGVSFPAPVLSAPNPADNAALKRNAFGTSLTVPGGKETFEYVMENRADPFFPFLSKRLPDVTSDETTDIHPQRQLTGMQMFEPEQLTLVALLWQEDTYIAMAEDFKKKGYVLREGMKIGRRGVVRAITSGRVVIEETATTPSGKRVVGNIVMTLGKEGNE